MTQEYPEGRVAYKLLLLSDGPCTAESFRPLEDKSQWWARRDALVRIIYAQNQGQMVNSTNIAESFSYIMYHNGNPKTDDKSVSLMSVSISGETHLSEEDVISAMKKASKQNQSNLRLETARFLNGPSITCQYLSNQDSHSGFTVAASQQSSRIVVPSLPENASKKAILSVLQMHCNMEHLRKHQLNASTEIVLKKKNIQQLKDAWQDWQKQVGTNDNDRILKSEFSEEENALVASYMQVFRSCTLWSQTFPSTSTLSVLLLHEDYRYELPVFHNVVAANLPVNGNHTVLYVLGAVRDMTIMESRCLLEASKLFGCPLVTANLGRTAEFTSKIVMALRSHALHKDSLFHAVSRLQQLQEQSSEGSELLRKLVSIRGNHSTWDGYTTSHGEMKDQETHVFEQANNSVAIARLCQHSIQHIIVATRIPFAACSLSLDLSRRSEFLPVLRLIVFTLWKSRVVCDQQDLANAENLSGIDLPITNTLYLSFSCGLLLKITQACIAEEVTNHHCPAPSEYQLLSMLQRLVEKSTASSYSISSGPIQSTTQVLKQVYKDIVQQSAENIPGKIYTGSLSEEFSSLPCLTDVAYSLRCWCDGSLTCFENDNNNSSEYLVLCVSTPSCIDFPASLSAECDNDILSQLPKKFRKKISKGYLGQINLFNSQCRLSRSFQICVLQHFAYHGILFPSLGKYQKLFHHETLDDIENSTNIDEPMDDPQIKKSKKRSKKDKEGEEEKQSKKKKKKSSD